MADEITLPPNRILDKTSFEAIYGLYWNKVFRTCYNHCNDRDVCREMVQEIFCSLWERRETLVIEGPIEHYLIKAAKYKVIDYLRAKPKQLMSVSEERFEFSCHSSTCTEHDVLYNSLNEKVGELVDRLPCQCRQVYIMSREKGMDTKQIASALLLSEKTVKNHLTKALTFLRLHLEEFQ